MQAVEANAKPSQKADVRHPVEKGIPVIQFEALEPRGRVVHFFENDDRNGLFK